MAASNWSADAYVEPLVFNTTWFGLNLLSTAGTDNVVGATRTFGINANNSVTLTEEVRDSVFHDDEAWDLRCWLIRESKLADRL